MIKFNLLIQTTRPATLPDTAKNWEDLNQDFWFAIDGEVYKIPAGYRWNGASIPRAVWWIVGSNSSPDLRAFSLIHDWLYLTHHTIREMADAVGYRVLQLSDVSAWRCRVIWGAVRAFGGVSAWGNKESDKKQIQEIIGLLSARTDSYEWTAEANYLRGLL